MGPPTAFVVQPGSSEFYLKWTAPEFGGGASTLAAYYLTYTSGGISDSILLPGNTDEANISGLDSNRAYNVQLLPQGSNFVFGSHAELTAITRKN